VVREEKEGIQEFVRRTVGKLSFMKKFHEGGENKYRPREWKGFS